MCVRLGNKSVISLFNHADELPATRISERVTLHEFNNKKRRRCTMICVTIILCYLFTCCTHQHVATTTTNTKTTTISGTSGSVEGIGLEELKHDNVHKLMSEQDLRRTFQVDSHDQVPEYEILKLTVNQHDGSHLISPISDLGELTTTNNSTANKASPNITTNPTTNLNPTQMKVSIFGKVFHLRLKRNADFQQRIKDMKMFMVESTKDGQLRYTSLASKAAKEVPNETKRSKEDREGDAERRPTAADNTKQGDHISSSSAANVWNIGSTYHDEDNLAALLIDHDRKTGQLRVDGTIGNDFVIKPMPQATIDALLLKQQQELMRNQQRQQQQQVEQLAVSQSGQAAKAASNESATVGRSEPSAADLEIGAATANKPAEGQPKGQQKNEPSLEQAMHMHDDDPHDDDEMFLDEDEAIELAHLQSSASVESSHNGAPDAKANASLAEPQQAAGHNQSLPQQQPRALSKAASERKWKKYRKLMAQTQVPKPSALSAQNDQQQQQQQQRARRHASKQEEPAETAHQLRVSHHIVYRQKPSAEGSSSEHQHSFMISPGQYAASLASMEQMALNFSPQRLKKRAVEPEADNERQVVDNDQDDDDNMIDGRLGGAPEDADTDFAHDPLGGQFYLEPGTMTGIERAGYSDWSLMSSAGRRAGLAPPPYALNGSDAGAYFGADQTGELHRNRNNKTSSHHNLTAQETSRRRFKRQTRLAPGQVRRKRQAPDTVWPEVLLVVDYDSFLLHGGDSRDVKRYFVSFWNGVDLRYKLLVHPHIRISLAGMIVAKDRDATPYLERNRLRAPNADAVDAAGALTDMGKYLYREDRLPTYDLAVVITKLDMCRRRYEGGRCNRGTAGFAYVGGACVVNKRLEKVNSVAIIEDSGGFSGIIVAAHEVGHLLGCVHDGSPPPSYLGGPGATHCPWEDGFIMSDLRHTERGFRWSQCSVEQFKHFLNGETATCLYNYPHESQMLHRLLPGTMLSLDEQCKRDRGTNACFKDARVCAQLFCFDSASGYCVSYRPAAEGSPCGEAQVCRNGKCVGEIENIIPDYTHQTQTVVARRPHSVTSRLADNGLSASSTSTATSSPDSKFPPPASVNTINPSNQLISRMDTFPIDTPLSGPPSSAAYPHTTGSTNYPFGGRHSSGGSVVADGGSPVMLLRQGGISTSVPANGSPMHYTTLKSGKLVADGHHSGGNKQQSSYQQRSGHQAIPKGANNQGVVKQYDNHHHPHSSTGLYTSASTMSHQYPQSTPSGNNLLTAVSTNSVTMGKKQQQQQQQQQLFDNQRIMYHQPINKHSESQSHINNNQHRVNRNHASVNHPLYHNGHSTSTSSGRLYNPLSQTTTVT